MGALNHTDVLIIGGGITARRAAKIIAEKYAVTLVCDGLGASPYVHGLNVPLLMDDSEELFYTDTLISGKWQNDKELVRVLTRGAEEVKREFYADFDKKPSGEFDLLKPLGSSVPRVASINGRTGAKILRDLEAINNCTVIENARALSLIKKENSVIGAYVYDKKRAVHFPVYARAVLIASGGFGGIFRFSTNSQDIGGDGVAMALLAGAALTDMEFIQYEPTVAIAPTALIGKSVITTMLFEGAVMRNKNGERFMDERVGKDELSLGIAKEIARGGGTKEGGVYYDMTGVPYEMLTGKYKDYYHRYKNHGIDISKTPVEIAPAPHTTMGGIKIDTACRTSIDGLFAAGEAAGGVHGANRLGGNAGLEVLVFGDTAGYAITDYLDKKLDTGATLSLNEAREYPDMPHDTSKERAELLSLLDSALGVIKCQKDMLSAMDKIDGILEKCSQERKSFDLTRLKNDALAAKAVLVAALERRASVGAHVRSDSTLTNEEKYRIILVNENGEITAKKELLND